MKRFQKAIYSSFFLFPTIFFSCKSTPTQKVPDVIEEPQEQTDQIEESQSNTLQDLTETTNQDYIEDTTEENSPISEIIDRDEAYIILDEQMLEEITSDNKDENTLQEPIEDTLQDQIIEEQEDISNDSELTKETSEQDVVEENTEQLSEQSTQLEQDNSNSKEENLINSQQQSASEAPQTIQGNTQQQSKATENLNKTTESSKNETTEDETLIIQNDDIEYEEEEETSQSVLSNEEVKPSRSVKIKKNQYLDVSYPGTGWIYLGESNNTDLIRYMGRKIGDQDTTFSLRTKNEGSTILHFYRNDPLTGESINDYIEVISKGINTSADHIIAPEYTSETVHNGSVSQSNLSNKQDLESQDKSEDSNANTSNNQNYNNKVSDSSETLTYTNESTTVIETSDYTSEKDLQDDNTSTSDDKNASTEQTSLNNLSADELLKTAQSAYQRSEYEEALNYLTEFFNKAVSKLDEGYYLKGEILESNSSVRDIKQAMEAYQEIVNKYPQSVLWQKANEKVTYLKRFYFNIR